MVLQHCDHGDLHCGCCGDSVCSNVDHTEKDVTMIHMKERERVEKMKEYQNLIGKVVIALAIVIAGALIANAIQNTGSNLSNIAAALNTIAGQLN